MQRDVVDASWVQLLAAHHSCGTPRTRLLSFAAAAQISKSTAAHWCIGAARMVRIALCWARATNRPEDAAREGCAAGLVPGTEDVAFEVDVDLSTCDFAALAAAAGAQLPPRHRAVAFHFQGKAIGPGSAPLASYGVRRGRHRAGRRAAGAVRGSRGRGPPLQDDPPRRWSATGRGGSMVAVVSLIGSWDRRAARSAQANDSGG